MASIHITHRHLNFKFHCDRWCVVAYCSVLSADAADQYAVSAACSEWFALSYVAATFAVPVMRRIRHYATCQYDHSKRNNAGLNELTTCHQQLARFIALRSAQSDGESESNAGSDTDHATATAADSECALYFAYATHMHQQMWQFAELLSGQHVLHDTLDAQRMFPTLPSSFTGSDESAAGLSAATFSLPYLDLSKLPFISGPQLRSLCAIPALQNSVTTVILDDCSQLVDAHIEPLTQLRQLHTLSLANCSNLQGRHLLEFTALTSLNVQMCGSLRGTVDTAYMPALRETLLVSLC